MSSMARTCFTFLLLVNCLLISFVNAQPIKWCVAKANAPADKLQGFIDYACGVVDCGPIQPGAPCFEPNDVPSHATFALNQVYLERRGCNFDIGELTSFNPSHGDCQLRGGI